MYSSLLGYELTRQNVHFRMTRRKENIYFKWDNSFIIIQVKVDPTRLVLLCINRMWLELDRPKSSLLEDWEIIEIKESIWNCKVWKRKRTRKYINWSIERWIIFEDTGWYSSADGVKCDDSQFCNFAILVETEIIPNLLPWVTIRYHNISTRNY